MSNQTSSTDSATGTASPPGLSLVVAVSDSTLTISSEKPGRAQVKSLFRYFIGYWITETGTDVLVVARRRTSAVFESVSKWWTKWLHRAAAATLWMLFGSYLFMDKGVVGIAMDRIWIQGKSVWEPQALAILIALLLILSWAVGAKRSGLAALYVFFFPFVALWVAASKAFGTASVIALSIRTVGSFSISGANWILLIVACIAVDRTSSPWIVVVSTAFLAIGVVYVVLSNFYWVTTPFNSVLQFAHWAQRTAWGAASKTQNELVQLVAKISGARAAAREKLRDEIVTKAKAIADQAKYALVVADRTKSITGGKIVLFYVFAARFLLALAAVILGFSGIYRGLDKLSPGSFTGHGINSLWYSFYYSVVTFFTVGDGTVSPASSLAQLAIVAEVVFAVLTLTVLALSFSTLSVDIANENASAVERVARAHYDACIQILRRRCGVKADGPVDAMEQLKNEFDKAMRRANRSREREDAQVKLGSQNDAEGEVNASPSLLPSVQLTDTGVNSAQTKDSEEIA